MSQVTSITSLQTGGTVGRGTGELVVDPCRAPKRRRLCSEESVLYLNSTKSTQNDYEDIAPIIPSITSKERNEHLVGEQICNSAPSSGDPDSSDVDNGNETDGKVLEAQDSSDLVDCCYGMLSGILVRATQTSKSLESSQNIPVVLKAPNILSPHTGNLDISFQIQCPTTVKVLDELRATVYISLQLYCHTTAELPCPIKKPQKGKRRGKGSQSWFLNIILYGPTALSDAIGEFFSGHQIYLQDPLGCDRRVLYRNPHIVKPEIEDKVMTDVFDASYGNLGVERLEIGPDLLAQLMEDAVPLPETDAPAIVTTKLFPHQKQALTFMVRREQGWAFDEPGRDVWTKESLFTRPGYRNNINGTVRDEPPPKFQGGLLADDMGLGKTLSMICLIASNQAVMEPPLSLIHPTATGRIQYPKIKPTLLVVPPSLIQSWENQFAMHIGGNNLKINVFHGNNRKEVDSLGKYDVVITSFYTVSAIWRKQNDLQDPTKTIFSVRWHRIVLDEAHTIQNADSQLAQACCALLACNRWAITGTPIQNKLTDFASIIRFLQVYPYLTQETFDDDISRPWRRGDRQGFLRLKALVQAITISRTKAVVDLPPRDNFIYHLDFSPDERQVYDDAEKKTATMIRNTSFSSQGYRTFNALQRLNILRLICSHGLLSQSNFVPAASQLSQRCPPIWSQNNTADSFYSELLSGSSTCFQCGMDLLEDLLEGSPSAGMDPSALESKRRTALCERCASQGPQTEPSESSPPHPDDPLDTLDSPIDERLSSTGKVQSASLIDSMPTKLKALTEDLVKHSMAQKCVVFSYWTYTLDLVQIMLKHHGICNTRIDGKTGLPKRSEALQFFARDDSLRVILVSIRCGGAGLDLTAASRVYLLEPHWNPMIEEQALCRVHRVGQKRNVTTIRYLMRNSFEEQVVEIQKRKKKLAEVTFGHDPLSEGGIGIATLQYLKSVVG